MRVFLSGATGFLGRALTAALVNRGDEVFALSRSATSRLPGARMVEGDPSRMDARTAWPEAVRGCHAVVHLAGESIGGRRWSRGQKDRILRSRVEGTRNIVGAITRAPAPERPRVLLVPSGVDYYPFDATDRAYAETDGPAETFLGRVCRAWEDEAGRATAPGVRVASFRTGLVIGRGSVALDKMALPFRLFAGGPVGTGRQWISWVHLDDVVGAYLFALDHDSIQGPVNLVAPGAVLQRDFARALGRALRRPSWAPVPGPILRLMVGELAEYLLEGRRAVPTALEQVGYTFRFAEAGPALEASFG